jgi:hypothetical protein
VSIDFRVEDVTRLTTIVGPLNSFWISVVSQPGDRRQGHYMRRLKHLLAPSGTYLMYGFFHQTGESSPGLTEFDLTLFDKDFTLVTRKDGTERGLRPSAWFDYRRTQRKAHSIPLSEAI